MRISPLLTILAALVAVVVVGFAAARLLQPSRPLLTETSVSLSQLSTDSGAAIIHYTLNRDAQVTIALRNAAGTEYAFRSTQARVANVYQVAFNGIVDGFTLPADPIDQTIESRLIPNGDYTWRISAKTDGGETQEVTGRLTVAFADTALPLIEDFSVSPKVFTPNQDGVDDRVQVNAFLAKKSTLTVYLQDTAGTQHFMPERVEIRQPGEPGAHVFDYDGGVDNNVRPPPNGDYTLIARAQDSEGQSVSRSTTVTIKDGGLPQVEIQPQTTGSIIRYVTQPFADTVAAPVGISSSQATITMNQGDLLVFRLNIHNYGSTPIRTIGPWPGTVYRDDQTDAVFTNQEKVARDGSWRIGFECDTSETTLPWRWAIGAQDALTKVTTDKGDTFYYLMPGQNVTVWGAIQMNKLIKTRNPQTCWASLIHENVAISDFQRNIGAIQVKLIPTP